jgi:hypothetical protein
VGCGVDAMNNITTVRASEFILLDHHPDLSRKPEATPGLIDAANRGAALAWNVFRTLELIAQAFWLRRFRARLDVLTSLEPVDRSLSVRLWANLPTPSERRHREPVCVDALIETDSAVYGVMAFAGSDLEFGDSTLARPDAILRVIDAVSWYAGARNCYIALISSDWSDTPIGSGLIERYRGARDVLRRRLPHRWDGLMNLRGIGKITWREVAGIIQDCSDSDSLTDLERFAASRTGRWLDSLGIHPPD